MSAMLAGRYEATQLLGRGAMGEVWLARDTLLGRTVAIKRILTGPATTDATLAERMMREARLAATLQHPNVVAVYDIIHEGGVPNLVMEYVQGETLADRLKRTGRLAPTEAAGLISGICDALAHAHSAGILHRDVKPANVLVDARSRAKLADFGIARAGGSGDTALTGTGQFIGTVQYLAPEIALGQPATPASDMYALGATLYALVEGRSPLDTGSAADEATAAQLLRLVSTPPRQPEHAGPLIDLLGRLLATAPEHRPDAATSAALVGRHRRRPRARQPGWVRHRWRVGGGWDRGRCCDRSGARRRHGAAHPGWNATARVVADCPAAAGGCADSAERRHTRERSELLGWDTAPIAAAAGDRRGRGSLRRCGGRGFHAHATRKFAFVDPDDGCGEHHLSGGVRGTPEFGDRGTPGHRDGGASGDRHRIRTPDSGDLPGSAAHRAGVWTLWHWAVCGGSGRQLGDELPLCAERADDVHRWSRRHALHSRGVEPGDLQAVCHDLHGNAAGDLHGRQQRDRLPLRGSGDLPWLIGRLVGARGGRHLPAWSSSRVRPWESLGLG